ncbi:helix-turn-helix transcriptional regulator [Lentzea sp. HUAS12]|uniref:helix-turn-helix transcriptional regulator n=1 Tax=Lentzea sp. HUAS12 TaxID=2951806 RepID=UPI00209CB417|nr:helix-turn-helix transcriptional regulator [Lentzea sp. HUAS12]USX52306.1 helix-turn-helix transcriptional regulator [Lentzea sp. HUAS12]
MDQAGALAVVLPDSPTALAALTCVHAGELTVARSLLAKAVQDDSGRGCSLTVTSCCSPAWNSSAVTPGRHSCSHVRTSQGSREALLAATLEFGVVVRPCALDGRALLEPGMRADAAGLAGHATMHTTDREAMTQLLDIARQFHGGGGESSGGAAVLSEREQEVAALVRDRLTHREVGDALFISPKTVEHHVIRIRDKLDAKNRRELERAVEDVDLS